MIHVPLIISLLVFSAILLFVSALLVHLGYVRGRQTIMEKIKQSGQRANPDRVAGPAPSSGNSGLSGRWLAIMTRLGSIAKPKEEEGVSTFKGFS